MLKSKVYVVKSAGKESKEVAIINTEIQIPPNPYSFGIYLPKVKKKNTKVTLQVVNVMPFC